MDDRRNWEEVERIVRGYMRQRHGEDFDFVRSVNYVEKDEYRSWTLTPNNECGVFDGGIGNYADALVLIVFVDDKCPETRQARPADIPEWFFDTDETNHMYVTRQEAFDAASDVLEWGIASPATCRVDAMTVAITGDHRAKIRHFVGLAAVTVS